MSIGRINQSEVFTPEPPFSKQILSCIKEKIILCFAFVIGSAVGGALGLVIPSGTIGLGAYLLDKYHFIDIHTNQIDLLDPAFYMVFGGLLGLAFGSKMGGLKGLSIGSKICHHI